MKEFLISILLLSSVFGGLGYTEATESEKEPGEETQTKTTEKPKSNPLREFVPSEEISIDKPVAFPVDI